MCCWARAAFLFILLQEMGAQPPSPALTLGRAEEWTGLAQCRIQVISELSPVRYRMQCPSA